MTAEELDRLHRLVHDAQAVVDRPWARGEESRPIEFFTDHLADDGWRLGWTLVAALRGAAPELFAHYDEERLHRAALDFILASSAPPSLPQVVVALRTEATDTAGP